MKPVLFNRFFSLDEAGLAFETLNKGQTYGKVIIRIKDEEKSKM